MRDAYQVTQLIVLVDAAETANAWFVGMNPYLDHRAHDWVISTNPDRGERAMDAALTYVLPRQ